MVYRSVEPQPRRGSTEWGARQFYRLLDDEERIAAERERLLAMGWRPPRAASRTQPFSEEPVFGDERDVYADLMQQNHELSRALDGEARRRIEAQLGRGMDIHSGQADGGRFGVPIPPRSMPGSPAVGNGLYREIGAKEEIAKAITRILPWLGMAEIARESADQNRAEGEDPFGFDFNASQRDIVPPPPPIPPRDFDPEEAARIQREFGSGTPNIPPLIEIPPESLPIQDLKIPNIFVGPNPSNPPQFPTWFENRGTPATQWDTTGYADRVVSVGNQENSNLYRTHGGYDSNGNPSKEEHYRHLDTEGRKWGNFADSTIVNSKTKRKLLLQTVDTNADWMTLSDREWLNNLRLMYNKRSGDYLVLVPKGVPAEQIDWDAFDQAIRPLVREINRPWNPGGISEELNPDRGWTFIGTHRLFK